jgi:hypothetical protein
VCLCLERPFKNRIILDSRWRVKRSLSELFKIRDMRLLFRFLFLNIFPHVLMAFEPSEIDTAIVKYREILPSAPGAYAAFSGLQSSICHLQSYADLNQSPGHRRSFDELSQHVKGQTKTLVGPVFLVGSMDARLDRPADADARKLSNLLAAHRHCPVESVCDRRSWRFARHRFLA